MNNLIYFLATSNCEMNSSDKLLICVIILLFITIVWTILIGIMFKLNERRYYYNQLLRNGNNDFDGRYILDEDKKEEDVVAKKVIVESPKKTTKKTTKKVVRVSANKENETYVKIRFLKSDKKIIYIAPKGVTLSTGDRIKVRVDNDTVRTAVVVKGNYTRKVYKNNDTYKTLELSD